MSLGIYTTKEQIQKRYTLIGKHQNQIPHGSKLMKITYTLHIATDPRLLQWTMNLADAKGNPIECNIQYGYAFVFWDGILGHWGVSYHDGRTDIVMSASQIERIITELERHNSYGDLGHDSECGVLGDYREDDHLRDDDRAKWRK